MKTLIWLILLCSVTFAQQPCSRQPVLHMRNAITIEEIKDYLSYSRNMDDWIDNVKRIRELNNGQLPSWWNLEIIRSQYFDGLRRSWGHGLAETAQRKH